jgi:hypothetical protein
MKIRTIIREQLLKELNMSRERGLLSHITMKYESIGDSFTGRENPGEIWYNRGEFKKLLMYKFKMSGESVDDVIDEYLKVQKNKNFGI